MVKLIFQQIEKRLSVCVDAHDNDIFSRLCYTFSQTSNFTSKGKIKFISVNGSKLILLQNDWYIIPFNVTYLEVFMFLITSNACCIQGPIAASGRADISARMISRCGKYGLKHWRNLTSENSR